MRKVFELLNPKWFIRRIKKCMGKSKRNNDDLFDHPFAIF
jgi:hypothetical protein